MLSSKIRAVYFKELRDCLRDRRTLLASVVVPLLLYPVMLLGLAEVSQMTQARMERDEYKVAIPMGMEEYFGKLSSLPPDNPELLKLFDLYDKNAEQAKIKAMAKEMEKSGGEIDSAKKKKQTEPKLAFVGMTEVEADDALTHGAIQAAITVPADFEELIKNGKSTAIEVKYDAAEHRSREAWSRLDHMLSKLKRSLVAQRLGETQISAEALNPFTFQAKNVAEAAKVGGSLLGIILPLLFIMMIITGAIYPAIEMTAGEKEHMTLETLIGMPIRPIEIIAGKFLAVASMATFTAMLNMASFGLTFSLIPSPQMSQFQFPWAALPLTMLLLFPLTLFFSALLLAVASFAKNHKEAQVFCLPIYLVPVLSMTITMMPSIELEGPLLIAPVVNTALLIKKLFLFQGTTTEIFFVFCSTSLYAAGAVALAARIFAREEVLFSAQGSLKLFLNRRFFKPSATPRAGDSLLVIALLFPINFYFQMWLGKMLLTEDGLSTGSFVWLVALPQYLLFLGLPLAAAWYLKLDFKKTFQWAMPSGRSISGAVLMGLGSWVVVKQLMAWQSHVWEFNSSDSDLLEKAILPLLNSGWGIALMVFLIGLTPAICEEHLFRGFMQQGLTKSGKWLAVITVGVVFGAYHLPMAKQPIIMLMGTVIAFMAFETRSLWPGVIYHFLHNSLSLVGPTIVGMKEETPAPGEPFANVPLQFLLPAAALFGIGLILVRRGKPAAAEPTNMQGPRVETAAPVMAGMKS